jgi:hypothetical protein
MEAAMQELEATFLEDAPAARRTVRKARRPR